MFTKMFDDVVNVQQHLLKCNYMYRMLSIDRPKSSIYTIYSLEIVHKNKQSIVVEFRTIFYYCIFWSYIPLPLFCNNI